MVLVKPDKIFMTSINNLIQSKISNQIYISAVKSNIQHENFGADSLSDIIVECKNCSNSNQTIVKLILNSTTSYFEADVRTMKTSLVLKEDILINQILSQKSFVKKLVPVKHTETPFLKMSELPFYKATRHLKKGSVLLPQQIAKINLVTYGAEVTCVLKNQGMHLETKGLARASGKHADIINLINPKTKKMFTGKVIGNNKVKVEL
jgi:flagella basal body P-ring formation protein FlgA